MINLKKNTEAILQRLKGLLIWCWNPSIEKGEYYWLVINTLFKVIQKHNCNAISFDWYIHLFFMKTGCEIKMIETQNHIIRDFYLLKNIIVQRGKNKVIVWYREKNGHTLYSKILAPFLRKKFLKVSAPKMQ